MIELRRVVLRGVVASVLAACADAPRRDTAAASAIGYKHMRRLDSTTASTLELRVEAVDAVERVEMVVYR